MRLLNFKKRNKKPVVKNQLSSFDYRQSASSISSSSAPNVNNKKFDQEDGLNNINCDFRASLLEDIMRELHTSNQQHHQPRQNHNAQTGQGHIGLRQCGSNEPPPAAVASTFVSPSSTKEGDQNGEGPFSSPPIIENDITPTFTNTPFSSSLITSSPNERNEKTPPLIATPEESDHASRALSKMTDSRSWKIKGKKKKADQGIFFTLPLSNSPQLSKYLSNSYFGPGDNESNADDYQKSRISKKPNRPDKPDKEKMSSQLAEENDYRTTYTRESSTNNNEKNNWKKQHLIQVPPYPDRLRKELQLIETGKKSYSVPDFSILRHDWQENNKSNDIDDSKQCQQDHQHYHYHHHYTLLPTLICHHDHPMYQHHQHHNQSPSPQHQENQPNIKNPASDHCHHQHHHHHFNMTENAENDKRQFNQSPHHHPKPFLHCHQHIPYMASPCVTKFPYQ